MKGHGSVTYICEFCGEDFLGHPSRRKAKHIYCKPSHLERYNNVCCSKECGDQIKSQKMSGENNHQYGLKGKDNPTWKSDEKITNYGYKAIRMLNHPLRNQQDFVLEHQLVAEKYLLTEENSIEIDGEKYLKQEYQVHHIDENKLNNDPSNLIVLTKNEHMKLHGLKSKRKRDKNTGRFIKEDGKYDTEEEQV